MNEGRAAATPAKSKTGGMGSSFNGQDLLRQDNEPLPPSSVIRKVHVMTPTGITSPFEVQSDTTTINDLKRMIQELFRYDPKLFNLFIKRKRGKHGKQLDDFLTIEQCNIGSNVTLEMIQTPASSKDVCGGSLMDTLHRSTFLSPPVPPPNKEASISPDISPQNLVAVDPSAVLSSNPVTLSKLPRKSKLQDNHLATEKDKGRGRNPSSSSHRHLSPPLPARTHSKAVKSSKPKDHGLATEGDMGDAEKEAGKALLMLRNEDEGPNTMDGPLSLQLAEKERECEKSDPDYFPNLKTTK